MHKSGNAIRNWLVWFIATVFFAYQFILRLAPGLIISQIMEKYDVDATEYGIFSAMYYLGYAVMQIPVALLLDKYGPRIVGAVFVSVCALSSWVFVHTDNWGVVLICRFLLGAGSAAGFLSVSKVISLWFPSKIYGRMVGLSFSFGLMGAVYGGRPVSNLIDIFGWSSVISTIALIGFIVASLFIVFIPQSKIDPLEIKEDSKVLIKLVHVCANKRIIFLAFANLLLVGALEGFADVWGVSYLMHVYEYQKQEAATITSLIFVGMIVGAPLLSFIAERFNATYPLAVASGLYIAIAFFIMILMRPSVDESELLVLIFVIGVACCYQVLVFTIGTSMVSRSLTGIAVAFLNSINMLGGTFFHSLIGATMDYFWDDKIIDGVKIYGLESYNYSLISIPLAALVGGIILIILGINRPKNI